VAQVGKARRGGDAGAGIEGLEKGKGLTFQMEMGGKSDDGGKKAETVTGERGERDAVWL